FRGQVRTWDAAALELRRRLSSRKNGRGVAVLSEAVGSPTLEEQVAAFKKDYPEARWIQYEPALPANALAGTRRAFDARAFPVPPDVARADVIVSLDADFLGSGPGWLAYTRQFADRRREGGKGPRNQGEPGASATGGRMNRLYVVESSIT